MADQLFIDEAMEAKALAVLEESLRATKRVRGPARTYEDQPDFSMRMKAAELVLAYRRGRPVVNQRNLNMNISDDSTPRTLSDAQIIKSLVEGTDLGELVKQLERKGSAPKQAVPVDAEAVDV